MTKTNTGFTKSIYELLSSMRFAISLLTVIAIASIIGTVLKQGEPYTNYAFQFGQFWFKIFESLGLYDVYHTSWFLTILTFLVISTSLCVYRNTPGILKEVRTYKEKASENSLRSFSQFKQIDQQISENKLSKLKSYLSQQGYKFRIVPGANDQTLIAAKKGSYNRAGYIFTHSAIVIICIGGLLDGNIPLKLQQIFGSKKMETRDVPQSQIPPESRLSTGNLSFRANVNVPEGTIVDVGFQNIENGYFVQELPFTIELKKFHIEHYTTGQPKNFASDVIVTNKKTGEKKTATIQVNKPLIYEGIAIYQANFADGGTKYKLKAWDFITSDNTPLDLESKNGSAVRLTRGEIAYTLEFVDFRAFNIENFGDPTKNKSNDTLLNSNSATAGLSSLPSQKDFRNVGPSFQYKLRDAQGQAKEFNNYMLPVNLEKRWYFMTGMRGTPSEQFQYMRIPADENNSLNGFLQFKSTILNPVERKKAAENFVAAAMQGEAISETLREKLLDSTNRVLDIFIDSGFDGVANFLEKSVPQAEKEKAAETYLKILDGAAWQALNLSRERMGLKAAPVDENTYHFIRDALSVVSARNLYESPIYLQLASYEEVKASGFQLTRSPGKNIVYLGSILLVAGIFTMFYIRERRLFLLAKPNDSQLLIAMSSNRKTIDFENEFKAHSAQIAQLMET